MSLLSRLKLNPAQPVIVLEAPENLTTEWTDWPVATHLSAPAGQVLLFVRNKVDLDTWGPQIAGHLARDARFWVAYPKKSGSIPSDLTRDEGWVVMEQLNFAGVMNVAVDADWSALRFRPAADIKNKIRDVPLTERQTPGVDYKGRTITDLPADVQQAFDAVSGLEAYFRGLSFSHTREHLEAIADAKKPETRARRIEKMTAMLVEGMQQKQQARTKS